MTIASPADLQSHLYEANASRHAGCGGDDAAALVYRRDISPLLPPPAAVPAVDLDCGRGELVRLLQTDDFDAEGIDISPEQAALARAAGLARVRQGDFRAILAKPEVLRTFDDMAAALAPGGVLVGRVPNAVSPLGGHIRNRDFTHQTVFTVRRIRRPVKGPGACESCREKPGMTGRVLLLSPSRGLGVIMRDCRATVLPQALPREWFDTLAAAAAGRPARGTGIPRRPPSGSKTGRRRDSLSWWKQ